MILNEEQAMLRETVAQFFAEKAPISQLRSLAGGSNQQGYDPQLWSEMVELGLPGITVPEVHDGLEFGWMGLGAIAQEAGRCLVASPLLSSVVLAQNLLLNCGSDEQIAAYLPSLISGEATATVALEEGRFFSADAIATSEASGALKGHKTRVLDVGQCSHIFCVAERASGDRGVAMFAPSAEGVAIGSKRTMDLHSAGSIQLDGVSTADVVWLAGDDVEGGIQRTIDQSTIVLAAEMMGSAREVLERTVAYLSEREQFDVKLGTFQALQHRCAHMYCELELAESAVSAALTGLDNDAPNVSVLASSAKALANDCFTLISSEAVQLHGGMGVTEEMDIGLFLKRSRVCNQLLGSSSYHRDRYARLNGF